MSAFLPLENDLLLRTLAGEITERPPVWMMRQAGRYLPQYRQLRERYDFFTRVETPSLAAEITLQPIDELGPDAAILFSDILVVPRAMGLEVEMHPGHGPHVPHPIAHSTEVDGLRGAEAVQELGYVMDALRETRRGLQGRVPLIGFAGAPWTLFCYMVEGGGSKEFTRAKQMLLQAPETAHALLDKITEATIAYLRAQVEAGAQALQLFDTWAGLIDPETFRTRMFPYLHRIVASVADVPVIVFARGAWHALPMLRSLPAAALAIDWQTPARYARQALGEDRVLQGNLDPHLLLAPPETIHKATLRMLEAFGPRHIANLGHGILPNVPVEHARTFVDTVKAFRYAD
jgi:uroporphyrinogen decarboxylase